MFIRNKKIQRETTFGSEAQHFWLLQSHQLKAQKQRYKLLPANMLKLLLEQAFKTHLSIGTSARTERITLIFCDKKKEDRNGIVADLST